MNGMETCKQRGDEDKLVMGVKECREFRPIVFPTQTRWGDPITNYKTQSALVPESELIRKEGLTCYEEEKEQYTWICYLNL